MKKYYLIQIWKNIISYKYEKYYLIQIWKILSHRNMKNII